MKLAVSGKGGVGKTTVSALLSHALKVSGHSVVAIDCDPDSNLLACMGYPNPDDVKPLVALKDLIEEKMGVKPGATGAMFRLNPFVEDIPSRYAIDIDGVRVLVAGAVKKGGSGCYCPENALVRALISHLLIEKDTDLVLDMEAGVEHLGRGTVKAVDTLLVVAEPGRRSVETALRVKEMAADIGLTRVLAIGNKVRSEHEGAFLKEALGDIELVGMLPYDGRIRDAEIAGRSVVKASEQMQASVQDIMRIIEERTAKR